MFSGSDIALLPKFVYIVRKLFKIHSKRSCWDWCALPVCIPQAHCFYCLWGTLKLFIVICSWTARAAPLWKQEKLKTSLLILKKTFSLLHGSGHFLSVIAPFGWFDVVGNFSWRFTIFPSLFVFPVRRRSFVLDLNRSKIVDQQSSFLL